MNCSAQNFHLKLIGNSISENKVLDSLNYTPKHTNLKSLSDEINLTSEKLSKKGFIEHQLLENTRENDSSYIAKFSLGKRINSMHIYIGRNSEIKDLISLDKKKDTITLTYEKIESFLSQTLQKLEQNGFALAKLKLVNIQKKKHSLYSDLQFESGLQRQLNTIVIKFSENDQKNSFPVGHLKQINRKYQNSTFNQDVVRKIHDDFDKFGFINQIKYPEILFMKDTTKVHVYLEKRKSNTFDGFIGFTNNENKKIVFNGYLDLTLENALKIGEQFSLNWKSDGNNQKTFKAGIDLPYLFKSAVGVKAQIYIFKQDSIFQNTKTSIDLGYFVNYNTRIYLGYQSTESSDIQNTNNSTISDYKNSFLSSNLEYSIFDYTNSIFPKTASVSLILGTGNRTTKGVSGSLATNKQLFINIHAMYNFYLNKKNCINIKSQNYYLQSDTYIINELFRFGGNNSIRGFAENSLQCSLLSSILTEYRFIVSPSLYLHSILDYAFYEDKNSKSKGDLYGIGIGTAIQTKSGILKLSFANGSAKKQVAKLYNTMVTICYNVKF